MIRWICAILAVAPTGAAACIEASSSLTGEMRPSLQLADLLPNERAGFEAVFAEELNILDNDGTTVDAAFSFARCPLGHEEGPTLLIFATGAPFCEGLCGIWGIEPDDEESWSMMLAAEGRLRLAGSVSMGRPDLIAEVPNEPAVAHKFDGVQYRDELEGMIYGEVFALPDATDWRADEAGFAGIAMGQPGPDGEGVIALDTVAEKVGGVRAGLTAGLTDLDGDDTPEVVVEGVGPDFCGPDGCRSWVVQIGDKPRIVADVISQGQIEVAASMQNGMRDLISWTDAGGRVLRFDGSEYR